jgi:hypothetical protein
MAYMYVHIYFYDTVVYIFNLYDAGEGNKDDGDDDGEGVLDMVTCKVMIKHLCGDSSHYESSPGSERYERF